MQSYTARLSSFSPPSRPKNLRWPHPDTYFATPTSLATAGFYFNPSTAAPDAVSCFLCDKGLAHWDPHDDPLLIHSQKCPSCPWAILKCVSDFADDGSVAFASPSRLPSSRRMQKARLATFGPESKPWWPHEAKNKGPNAITMAKAGFIYTPSGPKDDTCLCIYCNTTLAGWLPEDDPMEEHRKRQSKNGPCPFFTAQPNSKSKPTRNPSRSRSRVSKKQPSIDEDKDGDDDGRRTALSRNGHATPDEEHTDPSIAPSRKSRRKTRKPPQKHEDQDPGRGKKKGNTQLEPDSSGKAEPAEKHEDQEPGRRRKKTNVQPASDSSSKAEATEKRKDPKPGRGRKKANTLPESDSTDKVEAAEKREEERGRGRKKPNTPTESESLGNAEGAETRKGQKPGRRKKKASSQPESEPTHGDKIWVPEEAPKLARGENERDAQDDENKSPSCLVVPSKSFQSPEDEELAREEQALEEQARELMRAEEIAADQLSKDRISQMDTVIASVPSASPPVTLLPPFPSTPPPHPPTPPPPMTHIPFPDTSPFSTSYPPLTPAERAMPVEQWIRHEIAKGHERLGNDGRAKIEAFKRKAAEVARRIEQL